MNLRDLEYFVAVADTGQFSQAASRCHVSQPTLSGQVRRLEEELGSNLFERTTRQVRLSPFGREALVLARNILENTRNLERLARENRDPFLGPLRLGAFPTLGPWLLPRLAPVLMQAYPRTEFYLSEDKSPLLMEQLHAADLDAAFLALPLDRPGLTVLPLFREDFFLAVSRNHQWACQDSLSPGELEGAELLLLSDGHCLRDQSVDLCQKYGANEKDYFRATGLETLRQMVRMNTGMTLIPRLAVPGEIDTGICYLRVESPDFARDIGLCYRETHPRRAFFRHCADLIRGICGPDLPVRALGTEGPDQAPGSSGS